MFGLGAYHTLDLEANRDFRLVKGPGGWDSRDGEGGGSDKGGKRGGVGAVVLGEGELG